MKKVLVVDDEKDMVELVRYRLEKDGYSVVAASSGQQAIELIDKDAPSAVILDVMMPGTDGLDVLKHLRSNPKTAHLPVILLTARSEEADRIVGLELGADDYVVKPFSPRELMARLKAVMRRTERRSEEPETVVVAGPFRIDTARREVKVKDAVVPLTTTEFDLLHWMVKKKGRVFTRAELIEHARGDAVVTDRVVDAHVASLRRKLGAEAAEWIETVRGYGYRFKD